MIAAMLNAAPWMTRGLCASADSPDDWFGGPDDEYHQSAEYRARAKQLCQGCPVAQACLEHAMENGERHGIWGGIDFGYQAPSPYAIGDTCESGHLIEGDNVRRINRGGVVCRLCDNAKRRARRHRKNARNLTVMAAINQQKEVA